MPTVILLHGWAIDQPGETAVQKWQPLQQALETKGIQSILLNIPGLSTSLSEVWKLNDYVEWLDQTLHHLPNLKSPFILVGHSFGGQISTRYTARHSDMVEKLILIDSAGIRPKSFKARTKRALFWSAAKIGKILFRGEGFRSVLYTFAREKDYQQASPLLRQTMANVIAEEVTKDLSQIHQPALIVWGSDDRVTPLSHGEIFHRNIKGSELKVIPEARHSPQFTHVAEVASAIHHFVADRK